MHKHAKIYIAGHRGLVGSAITQQLRDDGFENIVTRTHQELDLTNKSAVNKFFQTERPEYVFLAAAKVGGILANDTFPAEFIHDNLEIQNSVIHASWQNDVERLMFLGSSCIYPKECQQPIREEYLLTGPLEMTNRPYALAKIAGIEMCRSYNRQYGTRFVAVMPTNLYGPGDTYDLEKSHVVPALIRKMHEAKARGDLSVNIWGSGLPRREMLFNRDMAEACIHVMNLDNDKYMQILQSDAGPMINMGVGDDITIAEIAKTIASVVGFTGNLVYDRTKPDGTMRKVLDVTRINKLGWRAKTSLAEGVQAAYHEWLARTSVAK